MIRWLLQIVLGLIGGVALAALFGLAGGWIGAVVGGPDTFADLAGIVLGGAVGFCLGTAVGVIIGAWFSGQRGSWLLALAGAVLGVALLGVAADPLDLGERSSLVRVAFGLIPVLLAMGGYHLRGRGEPAAE
jgi:hypothetical protein